VAALAFTVPEAAQGDGSLNGDADTADWVVHVWNGTSVGNLGLAGTQLVPRRGGGVAFAVGEGAQGSADLNGDGDTGDQVQFAASGTTATNLGYAVDGIRTVALAGGGLAFIVSEPAQGGADLNGDGDTADDALFVWDGTTSQQIEVEVELWLTPLDGVGVAFARFELGTRDLNGDGNFADRVVHVWRASGVLNLGLARETDANPLPSAAVDWRSSCRRATRATSTSTAMVPPPPATKSCTCGTGRPSLTSVTTPATTRPWRTPEPSPSTSARPRRTTT
jgi:hypothetical protein